LAKDVATQSEQFNDWMNKERDALAVIKGELEAQLDVIRAAKRKYETEGKDKFNRLVEANKKLEQAGVFKNTHTNLTVRTLRAAFEQLETSLEKQESLLTGELIRRQSNNNLPAEQLQEYKEVFQHFDRDNSGTLNRIEFKAVLQSLGDEVPDAEMEQIWSKLDVDGNGKLSFEEFTTFMINKNKDSDNKGEILESFKSLANDKEFVTEEDLRRVLPNEKVDFLVQHMPRYKDVPNAFDYVQWADQAFNN